MKKERPHRGKGSASQQPPAHADPEIFESDLGFDQLGLPEHVLRGIRDLGFEKPTLIQGRLIPAAMAGRDVLGQAKTGTGKTAAFGLPLLARCDPSVPFQALILAPTRELAVQIAD